MFRWAVIPKLDGGKWNGRVLVVRGPGINDERFLVGVYGDDNGIYIHKSEAKFFDDEESAERYLKALKVFG